MSRLAKEIGYSITYIHMLETNQRRVTDKLADEYMVAVKRFNGQPGPKKPTKPRKQRRTPRGAPTR